MDGILRPCRAYARADMDDVVVFSKSLKKHLKDLYAGFRDFTRLEMAGIVCVAKKVRYMIESLSMRYSKL